MKMGGMCGVLSVLVILVEMVVVLAVLLMVDILVGDPILMEGDACLYKSLGIFIFMLLVVGDVTMQYTVKRTLVIPARINPLISNFFPVFLFCLFLEVVTVWELFTLSELSLYESVVSSVVCVTWISS